MVSERKKRYMKSYNRRQEVKEKKADYMRKVRSEKDKAAAVELVKFLLEIGYEDIAFEYALERAPEMLVAVKNRMPVGEKAL